MWQPGQKLSSACVHCHAFTDSPCQIVQGWEVMTSFTPEKSSMAPSREFGNALRSWSRELPNSRPRTSLTRPKKIGAAPLRAPNRTCER